MESTDSCVDIESECPILCVAKAVLFALLAVFIVYCPLGDPYVLCNNADKPQNQWLVTSGFCDVYMMALKFYSKAKEVLMQLINKAMDILYEAKLKFYALLGQLDRDDLYQSVCCSDSVDNTEKANEEKRQGCKCTRKCCRNKIQM